MAQRTSTQIIHRLQSILAEARYTRLELIEQINHKQGELSGVEIEIETYENLIRWCERKPPLPRADG